MFNLTGRVVFIAGGAGYLAFPACRALLNQGARVAIGDYNKDALALAVKELTAEFSKELVLGIDFDIGNEDSILDSISSVVDHFGCLDVIVNATFSSIGKSVEQLSAKEFDWANRITITGSFLLARAASAAMKDGGSIILFSSMYGLISPNEADYPEGMLKNPVEYGAGKAAINQLTRYLAAEYGKRKIRVNAIAPGPFPSGSVQNENPEFIKNLAAKTMLGRIGRRDEIAGTVVFLSSDASNYMTGQILSVDGGVTAW